MLESINLELFGAFSAFLAVLIYFLSYFMKRNNKLEERLKEVRQDRINAQKEELEVMKTTNAMLNKMISEDSRES